MKNIRKVSNDLKKNGFAHISTLLTSSEIYKIEKSLINLITNL